MLAGNNIIKKFAEQIALDSIDINLNPGEINALIGPSGAGKTTVLRALSLIDPPSNGKVIIDNHQYAFPTSLNKDYEILWPKVTVVFQQLFLWPHLTLYDNIKMPVNQNDLDMDYAEELIRFFNLCDCVQRYPYKVSVGQRQRAAIVRAISLRPKYLLLDEVTSALDVEQIKNLSQCLSRICSEGCGVIIVTHLLGFARHIANRYSFIENGRILETGLIKNLDEPTTKRVEEFVSIM
ncbi:MAG: ATP-binding cassette domain-containing protein [Candidatus Lokiarchaeota archaeon]|nr:ATP-binding cassette domain-containing protein [Candidatus Lokiarchaeota archaeon]